MIHLEGSRKGVETREKSASSPHEGRRRDFWLPLMVPSDLLAYSALSKEDVGQDIIHQIKNDVVRTVTEKNPLEGTRLEPEGRGHLPPEERRKELLTVLMAFATYRKEIGYCQGISCYTAYLLLFFAPDEAFAVLCSTIERNRIVGLFDGRLSLVPKLLEVHSYVLQLTLPEVVRKRVEAISGGSCDYAVGWYLTLFSRCPPDLYAAILDMLFLYGFPVLFHVSSAVVEVGYFRHILKNPDGPDAQKQALFRLPYLSLPEPDLHRVLARNLSTLAIHSIERLFP